MHPWLQITLFPWVKADLGKVVDSYNWPTLGNVTILWHPKSKMEIFLRKTLELTLWDNKVKIAKSAPYKLL